MVRIFKTPKDDSVEETLRAMHTANTDETTNEWEVGGLSTSRACLGGGLESSAMESYAEFTLGG